MQPLPKPPLQAPWIVRLWRKLYCAAFLVYQSWYCCIMAPCCMCLSVRWRVIYMYNIAFGWFCLWAFVYCSVLLSWSGLITSCIADVAYAFSVLILYWRIFLDQELISYRYSSCCSCCWGRSVFEKTCGTSQKNVKSHVSFGFSKKTLKNVTT